MNSARGCRSTRYTTPPPENNLESPRYNRQSSCQEKAKAMTEIFNRRSCMVSLAGKRRRRNSSNHESLPAIDLNWAWVSQRNVDPLNNFPFTSIMSGRDRKKQSIFQQCSKMFFFCWSHIYIYVELIFEAQFVRTVIRIPSLIKETVKSSPSIIVLNTLVLKHLSVTFW